VEAIEKFRKAFGRSSPLATTQNYHKLLVYDLEATCNKSRSLAPIEIIEISCVIIDATIMKMQSEYQAFVRPTEHPLLDSFCVDLTGIQQQQVDAAEPLDAVLQQHHVWLHTQGVLDEGTTHAAVTWTEWDLKVAMCQECSWRRIQRPPYLCSWIDLKQHFQQKFKRAGNLRTCVEAAGLQWEGRAHSGLDDARNTAKLALKLMQLGVPLQITDFYEGAINKDSQDNWTGSKAAFTQDVKLASQSSSPLQAAGGGSSGGQEGAGGGLQSAGGLGKGFPAVGRGGDSQEAVQVFDSRGKWRGICFCNVKAHHRVTKKPGPNHGREFYSCGRWSISKQNRQCDFFMWADGTDKGT